MFKIIIKVFKFHIQIVVIFIASIILLSCGNNTSSEKNQREDSLANNNSKVKKENLISENHSELFIKKWYKGIFNKDVDFSTNDFSILEINLNNYKEDPNEILINQLKELEDFLDIKPTVKVFPFSIVINYTSEFNESLSLYFLEDKFIYTLFGGGASGVSYEYILNTKKFRQLDFVLWDLDNRIGVISRDYLDPRGSDDPNYQGRVSQDGTIDFYSGKIKWD